METVKLCTAWLYLCVTYLAQRYHISLEALTIIVLLLGFDIVIGITKSYILYWENSSWRSPRKLITWLLSKWSILAWFLCIAIVLWFYGAEDAWDLFWDISVWIFLIAILSWILQNVVMIVTKKEVEQRDALAVVFDKITTVIRSIVENWANIK